MPTRFSVTILPISPLYSPNKLATSHHFKGLIDHADTEAENSDPDLAEAASQAPSSEHTPFYSDLMVSGITQMKVTKFN